MRKGVNRDVEILAYRYMPYLENILEGISIGKGSEFLEIQIAFVDFAGREVVEWGKRVEVGGVCC